MHARACGTALIAWALAAPPAAAQCAPQPGSLTVRGRATVERKPDTATFTLSLSTRGPTLEGAARAHEARVARAGAALERLKAGGASVEAGPFSLEERTASPAPGARAPDRSFQAETRYTVVSRALGAVDGAAAAILATGLFAFSDVAFSVRDDAAAVDDARRAAMADARHQADVYADAAGLRLDGVERIEADGEGEALPPPVPLAAPARAASVGLSPPGAIPFGGAVTVVWRLAPR